MSTLAPTAAAPPARSRTGRASNGATHATSAAGEPSQSTSRIALASMVGTTIEYYDYLIFGTAAALVFGQVSFPQLGGATGALAALASLAVAFVFRPVGSVLFGHIGDRLGRREHFDHYLAADGNQHSWGRPAAQRREYRHSRPDPAGAVAGLPGSGRRR